MLYRNGNRWELCLYKVKFVQHGQPLEQYTHDKSWWEDFAAKWDHTEITEFEDVIYTDEQIKRQEEIKYIPEGFHGAIVDYVKSGLLPEGIEHPLRNIKLAKENERQGVELSEREIQEMIQGIQLSDLEIRLIMGGL